MLEPGFRLPEFSMSHLRATTPANPRWRDGVKGYPPENAETQPYGVGGSPAVLFHFLEFARNLSKTCLEGSLEKWVFTGVLT